MYDDINLMDNLTQVAIFLQEMYKYQYPMI